MSESRLAELLPQSSPACVHRWEMQPTSYLYRCVNDGCGYELTVRDLLQPHEGDARE